MERQEAARVALHIGQCPLADLELKEHFQIDGVLEWVLGV